MQSFLDIWKILSPFHSAFRKFIFLIAIYEGMQVIEAYSVGTVIKLNQMHVPLYGWFAFFACLVLYDEMFLFVDKFIDRRIVKTHCYGIYRYLKEISMNKFMEMDLGWHESKNSGVLVGKVNKGVDRVQKLIESLSWEFVPAVIQITLSLIPLLFISPFIALALSVGFCLFCLITYQTEGLIENLREARHDCYDTENGAMVQTVQTISTIRYSAQQERFLDSFNTLHAKIMTLGLAEYEVHMHGQTKVDIAQHGVTEVEKLVYGGSVARARVLMWTQRIILATLAWQLTQGQITVDIFLWVSVLVGKVISSVWRLSRLLRTAAEAQQGAKRLSELLQSESQVKNEGTIISVDKPLKIEFRDVSFGYEQDRPTLSDINLTIEPGQTVAFVGASGAGKSTLAGLILRRYDVSSGQIYIGGERIQDWEQQALYSHIGVVQQHTHIHDTTILKNLVMETPDITMEEVREACRKAHLLDTIERFPNGFDTMVGDRGVRLSGGQCQRVAMTRAFLKKGIEILVLDEPTSAQYSGTESFIQEALQNIGLTTIIIAHRLSTIRHADKIVVMDKGCIVETGTHQELIAHGGFYAKLVEKQHL